MTDYDPTERAFSRSTYPVFALVAALAAIHLLREALSPTADFRLLVELAFVPAQFTLPFDQQGVLRAAAEGVANGQIAREEAAWLLGAGVRWWTLLTYAFLHGSTAHIVLNSVWLLAFGAAVCRRFGAARFLVFLAITAICGAIAHYAVFPYALQPVIGASAAISGAMGAAVRFAFAPGAPLGAGFSRTRDLRVYRRPAPPLRATLVEGRAVTFLAVWFLGNFVFGAFAPVGGDATVAWQAHIGGFVAGFLLFGVFDPVPPASKDGR
jgi:membrane associated rhomboid family serine protease